MAAVRGVSADELVLRLRCPCWAVDEEASVGRDYFHDLADLDALDCLGEFDNRARAQQSGGASTTTWARGSETDACVSGIGNL